MKLNLIVTKENSGAELQHRYHDIGFETDPGEENSVVNLYPDILFEEFEGFGGALTDSAAYIYSLMYPAQKQKMLETYFSPEQMNYGVVRIHMDSCDFSTEMYEAMSDEKDTELKSFDAEEERKGIMGFFKRGTDKLESMKNKYAKAETNVNRIVEILEKHQIQLMKDAATMDKMYALNLNYFKELSMYILAGKKKLEEIRATELPQLIAKAQTTNLPEDAQAAKDLDSLCDRFEKKIHDLELTRMICIQTAPQIRLVQGNDTQMAEKIQSTIVNTIPLWKSQMVIALGIAHSTEAAKAQREVTDMTNALLQKNAETLKMATIESAKESERGIVDIETLKKTNESLISTFDEVMNIQREGREKRRAAEAEIYRLEGELKEKLLQIQK